MSQAVAYTPPDYVSPQELDASWAGAERRSRHPVDRLSRSLNRLCLEASDHYEIVAHLEALGYNSATTLGRLGVGSHFELAHSLYQRTPKLLPSKRPKASVRADLLTPLAMALAFGVTFLLGVRGGSAILAPAIFVLIWSQVGSTLVSRSKGELGEKQQRAVVALLMLLGLLGIGASWGYFRFGLETLESILVWFGVAGLVWAERRDLAVALPALIGLALGAEHLAGAPPATSHVVAVGATALLTLPHAWRVSGAAAAWLWRSRGFTLHPFLYGAGQGLLVLALLGRSPVGSEIVPGAALLLGILLLSQRLLVLFKARLAERLWGTPEVNAYVSYAQRALLVYAGAYLLPVAFAASYSLLQGPQAWFYHWHAFALFGLCLGLAVISFTVGDPAAPGVSFAVAGVAALLGAPFLPVCALLGTAQLLMLLWRLGRVERYAVFLL